MIGGRMTATIATLRAGDDVDAVFACARKDRLTARSGTPYLALELRDRSGAIQGRAFRDADVLAGRFERGELVRVRGRVERFRDELQVEVREIARAVGTLALEACQLHPRLNSDLLICAALVHDLGKTREFTYGAEIALSEEGRLLGHVVLGQQLIDARFAGSAEKRLALAHCVLTHHGADTAPGRRFGSPEALALYRLNALDASVKGALEHGLP